MSRVSPLGGSISTFHFFRERRASPALVCLAALPVAYVCSLPLLAVEDFAYRCPGFPRCRHSLTHFLTVGDFLANAQATGAYAAVFFWPLFHVWSLKAIISAVVGSGAGWLLVMVLYLGFGLSLVVPVTISELAHAAATTAYSVSALSIFTSLLWHFRNMDLCCFKLALIISVGCFFCCALVNGAGCLTPLLSKGAMQELPVTPWISYVFEACGLSCLSMLPWFWARDLVTEDRTLVIEGALARSFDTVSVVENPCSRCVLFFLAAMPAAYVWCLPWLATLGFAHLCEDYPRCADSDLGASVSNFIATPQATGAMASTFFWPMAHIWSHKGEMGGLGSFALLVAFYLFFGLFLSCPVNSYPEVHAVVVAAFCVCGLLYFRRMLVICREQDLQSCRALLIVSMTAFSAVIVMNITSLVGNIAGDRTIVRRTVPLLFYACEAAGLSSMSLFPWRWHVQHERVGN